jgi:hypothetical protein
VYLGPGFLASYWLAGFGTFLLGMVHASYWLEACAIFTPTLEKTINTAPTSLSALQAASQSTFINEQVYSTYD